jgi:hypothetical protein
MFLLTKWYLDCIDDSGGAVVLYWASLRWGLVRLHYGAVLVRHPSGAGVTRYTLRPGSSPLAAENQLTWDCARLGVAGTWVRRAPPLARTLLESDAGIIRWRCFSPRADAEVRLGDCTFRGCGYAEWLTMTVLPWRLPFGVLRWGRFHGAERTLVWIDLEGRSSRTWVFADGVERVDATVSADAVTLGDEGATLNLARVTALRSGRLVRTGLRPLRLLAGIMPRWRGAHESKWIEHAELAGPGGRTAGWALHEEVTWR